MIPPWMIEEQRWEREAEERPQLWIEAPEAIPPTSERSPREPAGGPIVIEIHGPDPARGPIVIEY